jgi:hypothetical protein
LSSVREFEVRESPQILDFLSKGTCIPRALLIVGTVVILKDSVRVEDLLRYPTLVFPQKKSTNEGGEEFGEMVILKDLIGWMFTPLDKISCPEKKKKGVSCTCVCSNQV